MKMSQYRRRSREGNMKTTTLIKAVPILLLLLVRIRLVDSRVPSQVQFGISRIFMSTTFHRRESSSLATTSKIQNNNNLLRTFIDDEDDENKEKEKGSTDHRILRGGAATSVIKTMTKRQMEAFNLFAGGIAGTVASCLTNPLEVVKMQLQSSIVSGGGSLVGARGHPVTIAQNILKRDGPAGFFRGLPPTLIGIIPSRSAYFYAYQRCKKALGQFHICQEGSPINAMISGLMAGLVSNTITNPIWMIKTRMTVLADLAVGQKNYNGYGDVIWSIYKEEGIKGFYKGIQASYWGCAEGAIQFLIYEQLKTRLEQRKRHRVLQSGRPITSNKDLELSFQEYFWSAALSKMLASICTYPHEVARTRLREQARSGIFKYKSMWQSIMLIGKEEGRTGLYGGMGIHLLKVVPNSAFMFLTYEIVRSWLNEFTIIDD